MQRQFRVNGIAGIETHIEILEEVVGGFETRVTSINRTGIRESREFMSEDLLNSCISTGYLTPESAPSSTQMILTA
jgi:hypothetical protein